MIRWLWDHIKGHDEEDIPPPVPPFRNDGAISNEELRIHLEASLRYWKYQLSQISRREPK